MNINNVIGAFKFGSVARSNRFELGGLAVPTEYVKDIYIRSVSFPAKSFGQSNVRNVGVPIKLPYDIIYNDVTLSFIDDDKMSFYQFYTDWFEKVYSGGLKNISTVGFSYYDDYVRDLYVYQLDTLNNVIKTTKCVNCYISNMSEISYSHEASTPTTFSVTLSYEYTVVQ